MFAVTLRDAGFSVSKDKMSTLALEVAGFYILKDKMFVLILDTRRRWSLCIEM